MRTPSLSTLLLVLPTLSLGAQDVPRLELEPCTGAANAQCGALTVWENRETRSGRTLSLEVVVLNPDGDRPLPDPIYVLTGGPGSAATNSAGGWAESAYRDRRAIVLMAQRGTGSQGLLCLHPDDAPVNTFLGPLFPTELMRSCRSTLERRADLAQYTTPASMDDLEDLRVALGHGQINIVGTSYGTRAALVYLRRHEPNVRSVVLRASMSMDQVMPKGLATDAEAALSAIFEACGTMADCAAKYPDLRSNYQTVNQRTRSPVNVRIEDPRTDTQTDAVMQPEGFDEGLRAMLYNPESARNIPRLLKAAAENGDYNGFAQLAANRAYGLSRAAATGMYLSITCAEDIPYVNQDEEYSAGLNTFLGDSRARPHFAACREWVRGTIPDNFHEPVRSDVPVLVLSGENDPITPPSYGAKTAEHLPNAMHIVVPHGGHGWGALENSSCVDRLEAAFLRTPDARLNMTCLQQIRRRPFR